MILFSWEKQILLDPYISRLDTSPKQVKQTNSHQLTTIRSWIDQLTQPVKKNITELSNLVQSSSTFFLRSHPHGPPGRYPGHFNNSFWRNFFLGGGLGKSGVPLQGMWAKSLIFKPNLETENEGLNLYNDGWVQMSKSQMVGNQPSKKKVIDFTGPRDPGLPKLRMVSWNLNDICGHMRFVSVIGHPLPIIWEYDDWFLGRVPGNRVPNISRWWFQTFFIFNPTWGNDPVWLIFFRWVETTNQILVEHFFSKKVTSNLTGSNRLILGAALNLVFGVSLDIRGGSVMWDTGLTMVWLMYANMIMIWRFKPTKFQHIYAYTAYNLLEFKLCLQNCLAQCSYTRRSISSDTCRKIGLKVPTMRGGIYI